MISVVINTYNAERHLAECLEAVKVREGTEWPPYVHTFPKVNGRVEKAPREYKMLHLADETTVQLIAKMNQYTDSEVDKKADRGFGVQDNREKAKGTSVIESCATSPTPVAVGVVL